MKRAFLATVAAVLAISCTACAGPGQTTTSSTDKSTESAKWSNITTASEIKFSDPKMVYMGIEGTEDWIQDVLNTFKGFGGEPEFLYPVWEQRHQQLATRITTKESPDLYKYESGSGDWPNLIVAGQVQCVDDLIDYDSPLFSHMKDAYESMKIGGKGYLLPAGIGNNRDTVLYNKKLFEDAGLETPYELYKKGEWTMDKMEEYAKQFTVIKDDGTVDSIGMYCVDEGPFIAATGKDIFEVGEDGKFVNNIKDPMIAKAMERIQRMYRDEKCMSMDQSTSRDLMIKGKMAMYAGPFWLIDTLKVLTNAGSLELVPFPKDPDADKWYLDGSITGFFIPRGAKNPDAALAWIAAQTEYDKNPEKMEREAAQNATKYNMNPEVTNLFKDMPISDEFEMMFLTYKNFDDFYQKFYNEFWDNLIQGESWSTIAERLSPAVDDQIKKLQAME